MIQLYHLHKFLGHHLLLFLNNTTNKIINFLTIVRSQWLILYLFQVVPSPPLEEQIIHPWAIPYLDDSTVTFC